MKLLEENPGGKTTFSNRPVYHTIRSTVAPGNKGPIDGWYVAPGTQFLTGLAVGGIIRERVSLDMAVGLKLTPPRFAGFMDGMMFGQIPFYGRIGFGIFI